MVRSMLALAILLLTISTPAAGQVARLGIAGSRWSFDEGTASQAPTVRPGMSISLGFESVRRVSPQFSAIFIPEGDIDPGLVAVAGELRAILLGSEDGLAFVGTVGGGPALVLAGNRERVVEGCRAPCMFEGVHYRTELDVMSTAGLGFLVPLGPRLSMMPSGSLVALMGDGVRVLQRLSVGLFWRR
jgi:hypothetical protein